MRQPRKRDPGVITFRAGDGYLYYRHPAAVRIAHWVNAAAFAILLMSGLNIFSAHPMLYWGQSSYNGREPVFQITARRTTAGVIGVTRALGFELVTTGAFGAGKGRNGGVVARTFPSWMMLPGTRWLSMARRWHFFFAWLFLVNGLCYLGYCATSGRLVRGLMPNRTDLRSIGQSIADHLRLRHPAGEAAKRYNVLQKLAYIAVIFALAPLMVLTGLAMSPWMDSVVPGMADAFGGRQSARTLHFVLASLLSAFVFIHLFEVMVSGPWNQVRAMITGRFRIAGIDPHEQAR